MFEDESGREWNWKENRNKVKDDVKRGKEYGNGIFVAMDFGDDLSNIINSVHEPITIFSEVCLQTDTLSFFFSFLNFLSISSFPSHCVPTIYSLHTHHLF